MVEKLFKQKLKEYFANNEVIDVTNEQDMKEHFDIKVELKFDVKSLKKIKRKDGNVDENYHYIELLNVQGKQGWLYGQATHFAFETNEYWVIVEKQKLQDFIKIKCKDKIKCETPALYQLYSRPNRKDIIVLVKIIDLMWLAEFILEK